MFQRILCSIPFLVQNFRLFLARTIIIASSIYCHNFKILSWLQDRLIQTRTPSDITLINLIQIYIHSVQTTGILQLKPHCSSFCYNHTSPLQHPDWCYCLVQCLEGPKHAPCLGACSVIIVHVLKNIFITETSNYTKRILHSHTDYPNNRANNWKKLTTEELNRSIVCHRSRDEKQEPYAGTQKPIAALSLVP